MRTAGNKFLAGLVLLLTTLLVTKADQHGDFRYTTDGVTVTITNYTGSGGAVTIPDTITNLPVTSIGAWAFSYCTGLTSVMIGNSVTNLGDWAFYSCTSLTNVTIPNSVISIGNTAFSYCTSLSAITVGASNSVYSSVDGVLFNKSQTILIQYPEGKSGSYTIPNSVTSVGNEAFYGCTSLTSVNIPDGVTSIGSGAFDHCVSLTNVNIPDGVTSIEIGTFSYCTSLTSITIPDSVTSIGTGAFDNCTSLTSITIPDSVTSIGTRAFQYCPSLTNVTIGNSVTSIGNYAFPLCTSLTNVTIPNSVASIGNFAFFGCTSLTGVYFKGNAPSVGSFVFDDDYMVTVYYLPGTTGWDQWVDPPPAVLWNPSFQTYDADFGVQTNGFSLVIMGTTNIPIVVEACTNLESAAWTPLHTCTLTNGSVYFSDPQWTNHSARFYRIRSP